MLEIGFQAIQRSLSEADGEIENGRMFRAKAGALVIEADAIGEDRVAQRLAPCATRQ